MNCAKRRTQVPLAFRASERATSNSLGRVNNRRNAAGERQRPVAARQKNGDDGFQEHPCV
jgi:hypothetical protein